MDALGWRAIEHLQSRDSVPAADLECCSSPATLPHLIEGHQGVVLLDAMQTAAPPGTLHQLQLSDLPQVQFYSNSHALGLNEALQLLQILDLLPEKLLILGINVGLKPTDILPNEWIATLAEAALLACHES